MAFNFGEAIVQQLVQSSDPMTKTNNEVVSKVIRDMDVEFITKQGDATATLNARLVEAQKAKAPTAVIKTYEKLLKKLEEL